MLKSFLLCGVAVLVMSIGSFLFADQPPGLEKKDKTPPGFTQGEKTGWQNQYPPGWDKMDAKGKKEWTQSVKLARERIRKHCKEKNFSEAETAAAADDFEKAVRNGLTLKESEALVESGIKGNKRGKDLTDAVAGETQKRLKMRARQAKGDKPEAAGEGDAGDKTVLERDKDQPKSEEATEKGNGGERGGKKGKGNGLGRGRGGNKN